MSYILRLEMADVFRPFPSTRKAEQVAEEILAAIRRAEVKSGTRLPDENSMAKQFGVSRNCVREALRILETLGVAEVRHGLGCFVLDGTGLPQLPYWLKSFESNPIELLEVREAVEVKAARLAAIRGSAEDLADIERVAGEAAALAAEPGTDASVFSHHDQAFHAAVSRASGNGFLVRLAPGAWASPARNVFRQEGRMLVSARQHQEISAAIAAHDPEAAAKAMSRHIQDTIDRMTADAAQIAKEREDAAADTQAEKAARR